MLQLPNILPTLPHISGVSFISTPVLMVMFLLFLIFYGIISSILIYHWIAYGMRSAGILVGQTLFLFISLILFTIAGLAIHYF